jgi:NADPH-dependent 2,4-dienoyl-CoA reductase/sulfur reductase-like enzyme
MSADAPRHYPLLVVGAGPAGLSAAAAAASQGLRVGLIDQQTQVGGQVWRHDLHHGAVARAQRLLCSPCIDWLGATEIVHAGHGSLWAETSRGCLQLRYEQLVLATGARELLLPFPGWTLPGVMGAGGAQALAKQGWPMRDRAVLVAGSGPLLLAAAATLRSHGAHMLGILEQCGRAELQRFAGRLWRWPGKLAQAAGLGLRLFGVPYHYDTRVLAAYGDEHLREVEIEGPAGRQRLACDLLAAGFGLVPNTELAQALGCHLQHHGAHPQVAVDDDLRTSVAGVFAAGEACGIGGRDCALIEGALAGHLAAGASAAVAGLRKRRQRARAFADWLGQHFQPGPAVLGLAADDTLVCRCEDVPLGRLRACNSLREARVHTRCGMGACQGRICASAVRALGLYPIDAAAGSARPPLFPARLDTLAALSLPDCQPQDQR